jgi:hypothetical protein
VRPIVALGAVALGLCMGCAVGKWGVWVGFVPGKVVKAGRYAAGCDGVAIMYGGEVFNQATGSCLLPRWYIFGAG